MYNAVTDELLTKLPNNADKISQIKLLIAEQTCVNSVPLGKYRHMGNK
jgi:hypothetical protein